MTPPIGRAMKPTQKVANASSVPIDRIEVREEQLVEDQRGGDAVEEEVVPLDGRADQARSCDRDVGRLLCPEFIDGDRSTHLASSLFANAHVRHASLCRAKSKVRARCGALCAKWLKTRQFRCRAGKEAHGARVRIPRLQTHSSLETQTEDGPDGEPEFGELLVKGRARDPQHLGGFGIWPLLAASACSSVCFSNSASASA